MTTRKKYSFWYRNGLSLTFGALLLCSLAGQIVTGRQEFNAEMAQQYDLPPVGLSEYLRTGHFLSTTFENWESEFLQMGLYVILTVFLRQKGSSESEPLEGPGASRKVTPASPWPVRRGGWWLKWYSHSLSLAFLLLFLVSYLLHLYGSWSHHNLVQRLEGLHLEPLGAYITSNRMWFESPQNWQSEFLSVLSIVVLSIFIREKGSPESKLVEAPHRETGA